MGALPTLYSFFALESKAVHPLAYTGNTISKVYGDIGALPL